MVVLFNVKNGTRVSYDPSSVAWGLFEYYVYVSIYNKIEYSSFVDSYKTSGLISKYKRTFQTEEEALSFINSLV